MHESMTVWAAYAGTVKYSTHGITLHATERDALIAVIEFCDAGTDHETPIPDDADELAELAQERADATDTDWYVDQCEIPRQVVPRPSTRPIVARTRKRRPGAVVRPRLIARAIESLTTARACLKAADAPRALARVRLALTSAHGALRHAHGIEGRELVADAAEAVERIDADELERYAAEQRRSSAP